MNALIHKNILVTEDELKDLLCSPQTTWLDLKDKKIKIHLTESTSVDFDNPKIKKVPLKKTLCEIIEYAYKQGLKQGKEENRRALKVALGLEDEDSYI